MSPAFLVLLVAIQAPRCLTLSIASLRRAGDLAFHRAPSREPLVADIRLDQLQRVALHRRQLGLCLDDLGLR